MAPSCNKFAAGLPGFCMGLLRRLRFSTADMELLFSGVCVEQRVCFVTTFLVAMSSSSSRRVGNGHF